MSLQPQQHDRSDGHHRQVVHLALLIRGHHPTPPLEPVPGFANSSVSQSCDDSPENAGRDVEATLGVSRMDGGLATPACLVGVWVRGGSSIPVS
jgi:hypothetical protein